MIFVYGGLFYCRTLYIKDGAKINIIRAKKYINWFHQ